MKNFKDGYHTNGLKGSDKRFYRFDTFHKDIEVYDGNGKNLGSLDPVTKKSYKPGTGIINQILKRIIK
ncbi:MAG: colicin E3/pyocin S6 family cytotoxin [Rickettsiales bacterium]